LANKQRLPPGTGYSRRAGVPSFIAYVTFRRVCEWTTTN